MQLQKGKFAMQTLLSNHDYLVPSQKPSLCWCHPGLFKGPFITFDIFTVLKGFTCFCFFVGCLTFNINLIQVLNLMDSRLAFHGAKLVALEIRGTWSYYTLVLQVKLTKYPSWKAPCKLSELVSNLFKSIFNQYRERNCGIVELNDFFWLAACLTIEDW